MKRVRVVRKACEDCSHCIPIGEGDFFCDEQVTIVIGDYEPTTEYYSCEGNSFDQN